MVYAALPVTSETNVWGDEIYFEIPIKVAAAAEEPTLAAKVGDLAYWPQGACFCLFFGKTLASVDDQPHPVGKVNLVGRLDTSSDILRKVKERFQVRVVKK